MKTYVEGDEIEISTMNNVASAVVLEDRGNEVKIRVNGKNGKIQIISKKRIRGSGVSTKRRDHMDPVANPRALVKARETVVSDDRPRARAVPKPEGPARSEIFMRFVRKLSCCSCNAPGPNDPHHWGGHRGMGQKTDDYRCVPLCRACHDHYHNTGLIPGQDHETTRIFLLMRQVDTLVSYMRSIDNTRRYPDTVMDVSE